MPAYLHSLETIVPEHTHSQEDLSLLLQDRFTDPRIRRLVGQAFRQSGIERRHMVVDGFFESGPFDANGQATTADRNAVYATESRRLASALGEKILSAPGAPAREEITHLIFATCTGFVNPGPDFYLVRDLGLRETVERYTLGFMGCYAAMPALKLAAQIDKPDVILGNTVFADGAAAAIVSSRHRPDKTTYRLDGFHGGTIPEGESAMAWSIGNQGFDLVLSSYVPKVIGSEIGTILRRIGVNLDEINRFAVHPGGKSILDRVISSLGLHENALDASRAVLRENGNMSSATILFVLKELITRGEAGDRVLALAFGPGLTIETAVLTIAEMA